jgi:AraC-like DNA-binding protein
LEEVIVKEDFVYYPWPLETPPAGSAVWLSGAGHYRNGFGSCRRAGVYDVCCPHFVLSGRGVFKTPTAERLFKPGDVFTLWPGIPYEFYEEPGDDPLSFNWLWITGDGAEAFGLACGFRPDRLLIRPSKPDAAALTLGQIMSIYENRKRCPPCEVLSLMYRLALECSGSAEDKREEHGSSAGLVTTAKAAIEAMLSTAVNVDTLARSLGVSRNTLLNAFRKEGMTSPGYYIRLRRVARSKELLERTDLTLSKVARAAGFANDKYLMRVFRKAEGISPGEWRRLKTVSREHMSF